MYAIAVTECNSCTRKQIMFGIRWLKKILELDELHCVRKARKFCKA
jgi:hypothetical protein